MGGTAVVVPMASEGLGGSVERRVRMWEEEGLRGLGKTFCRRSALIFFTYFWVLERRLWQKREIAGTRGVVRTMFGFELSELMALHSGRRK